MSPLSTTFELMHHSTRDAPTVAFRAGFLLATNAVLPDIPAYTHHGRKNIPAHHIHIHTGIMDRQTTYSLDLWGEQKSEVNEGQESNRQVQKKLVDFILSFAVDNTFVYRYVIA